MSESALWFLHSPIKTATHSWTALAHNIDHQWVGVTPLPLFRQIPFWGRINVFVGPFAACVGASNKCRAGLYGCGSWLQSVPNYYRVIVQHVRTAL